MNSNLIDLENNILKLVNQYGIAKYSKINKFEPGITHIPVSGKVISENELELMTKAVLDGWLTTGSFNTKFQNALTNFLGVKYAITTNSGSSANLLAISALTSPILDEKKLNPGDEVITVAAGFPTTINPIIQNNLIPVFVDIELRTLNIDYYQLERAISKKTKAIIIAHTLGNPFNAKIVKEIAVKHNLWLIEDCCDALGSKFEDKMVGNFGDIATLSFYPAHHITMGEGGAVLTNSAKLKKIIESFRDWGRDCYCAPGCDNTCKRRFDFQLGKLPSGYDHKYIYSHCGFNLKITDIQAACGLAQMSSLDSFIKKRKDNFKYLNERMANLSSYFIFPKVEDNADPSWFGFPLIMKSGKKNAREKLLRYLKTKNIGTRLLFAGNVIKQPYFEKISYKKIGELKNTDIVMERAFWLGVYPGLTKEMLDYVINCLEKYFSN